MPDHPPLRPTMTDLPPRVHGIVRQLLAALTSELRRELDRLLVAVEVEFSRQADRTRDPGVRGQRLAAVRAMQVNGGQFVPGYLRALEAALAEIRLPRPAFEALPPTTRLEGLRLVDDTEIDEDAELESVVARLERRSRLPLMLLGQRFGVLAGAPAYTATDLPVGPNRLVEYLSTATATLGIDLESRAALYRTFERQFGPEYPSLVESMNDLLSRERVLPGLTYVPLRRPKRAVEPAAGGGQAPGRDDASAAGEAAAGGSGYTAWTGSRGGDQDQAARAGSAEAVALLRRMLAGREAGQSPAEALLREAPPVALTAAEVDASLAALQSRSANTAAPPGVAAIRQALLAQSRLQRGHASALSPEDNETFELADMFQREVRRQLRPDTPSRAMVDRLQIPLLRVALRDPELFVDPQHPARRLLNAVAEAGARWIGPEEIDTGLLDQLQQAVDHVVARYDQDPSVFQAVGESLQQHFDKLAQRAEMSERRQVEARRGREKLVLARRNAQAAVAAAVGERKLPRFVRNLLEHAWVDVLTLEQLRHDADSPQWRERLADTDRIITAAGALDPAFAERVAHALTLVGYHREEATAIIGALGSGGDEPSASRTELALRMRERTRLGGGEVAIGGGDTDAPRSVAENVWHERLLALPAGTWIEFDTGTGGDIVRRRLAWSSAGTGDVLFVNHRGQRIDEGVPPSLDVLARQLASGRARVVPAAQGPLVDRAWHAALAALRGQARNGEEPR